MLKRTKILILILLMFVLVGVTSCEQGTINPGGDPDTPPVHIVTNLDTPTNVNATVKDETVEVVFDFVENASMYEILFENIATGEIIKEKIDPKFNKLVKKISVFTNGTYSVKVRAIGDNGEKYYNSAYSLTVEIVIENKTPELIKLDSPIITKIEKNSTDVTVYYSKVNNASGYQIIVKDSNASVVLTKEVDSNTVSYKFNTESFSEGNYKVSVIAKGDNKNYSSSDQSTPNEFNVSNQVKLSAPTNVSITNDASNVIVKFNGVNNATGYHIIVKDSSGKVTLSKVITNTSSALTINVSVLKDGEYNVTVIAKGDDVKYISSDASDSVSFKVKSGKPDTGEDKPIEYIDYYKQAEGLVGNALKAKLRTIITSTHNHITTYSELKKVLQHADQDPNNSSNMILYYTGVSVEKSDNMDIWNREHVWAKSLSWFNESDAGADAHHLRPCNPSVNSSRGNKKFGTASGYYNPYNVGGYGQDYRGDTARIIFYLMTRYSQSDSYGFTSIAQSLDMLLEWNRIDPVTPHEQHRNDYVYSVQGNRNPFIDYPEFADMIWK